PTTIRRLEPRALSMRFCGVTVDEYTSYLVRIPELPWDRAFTEGPGRQRRRIAGTSPLCSHFERCRGVGRRHDSIRVSRDSGPSQGVELRTKTPWKTPSATSACPAKNKPGNVRELEGCLKQALLQVRGPVLTADDLPSELARAKSAGKAPDASDADALLGYIRQRLAAGSTDLYAEALRRLDETLVREVLKHTGGNQAQAARLLGIARNSLRKKIQEQGITLERVVGEMANGAGRELK